ncbi:MAG TPA: hypothetical protein VHZ03_15860 [Trebonia sp.]|jgi:hypothetical protein|nr:hypothetical protein [Trebonia sp.]
MGMQLRLHHPGLARTFRTHWWPRFALAGVVLAIAGVTAFGGAAQAGAVLLGIAVFSFALLHGLGVHQRDPVDAQLGRDQMVLAGASCVGSLREPPVPPGGGPGSTADSRPDHARRTIRLRYRTAERSNRDSSVTRAGRQSNLNSER